MIDLILIIIFNYSVLKMLENSNSIYYKKILYLIYFNFICHLINLYININSIIILSDILLTYYIYKELQLLNINKKNIKNTNYVNFVYIINTLNIILYIYKFYIFYFKPSNQIKITNTI